jgi:hypothetical protein
VYVCIQGDLEKIREVCDEFLGKYPLCYAYWKQYAKAEADLGGHAESVLNRGVAATPYSIDLWLDYIERTNNNSAASVDDVRSCVSQTGKCYSQVLRTSLTLLLGVAALVWSLHALKCVSKKKPIMA